ncbi:MAG: polyhydroxybutyrate depolymerase [Solirubrobacteraceae bacterium]|jgi:polyhydroxybutyrate depolymerase|nr:polyhydroxybutyrate depolymerase [Solirubrobacteraceae bacterium]
MRARPSLRVALAVSAAGLLLAVAIVGLGGAGPAPAGQARPADAATACGLPAGRTVRVSVVVGGQGMRSALVHLPRTRGVHPLPLIVALHGAYADGAFMERYSGLSRLADRAGFAVVYPDSVGNFWRISAKADDADVRFIDGLLDRLLAGGCFDAGRVSAVGVSNGGGMAVRFACAGDDRLAGVVSVAGAYGPLPPCKARRPLSLLEVHGTADPVVPYRGSPADPGSDVVGFLKDWADRDACRPAPRVTLERPGVERLDWTGCRDATEIAHLRLIGGTHTWPGTEPPAPGPQLGVSASDEAWRFLRDRRLAPLTGRETG